MINEDIEITIEELAENIEMLIYEKGVECFEITEDFKKGGKRSYIVRGLHVEVEDEYILFYDAERKLIGRVLSMVLREFLLNIYHVKLDNKIYDELIFTFGHVYINSVAA